MTENTGNNPVGSEEGARKRVPFSLIHKTDLLLAAIILAICAGLFFETTRFPEVPPLVKQGIGPEFFPRVILWTIVILTLMVPFEHIFQARRGQSLDDDRARRIKPITYVTALLLLGVLVAMPYLGTFATMILVCAALPLLWGERRYWLIGIYAAAFPLLVGVLFFIGLKVNEVPGEVGYIFR